LQALVASGFEIVLAVTRPDRRRGRGRATSPSPVKEAAIQLGLPVAHRVDAVLEAGAELGVVVAYGQIIKREVLEALPMVNVHFSLLPRWRGAAPVERAILAGDAETGISIMRVEEGLDTGPVFVRRAVPVGPRTTADELRRELVREGTDLLVATLTAGLDDPEPQAEDGATYAAKLDPSELELDWTQPAAVLHRVVRVGGAWTWSRGKRLKVLAAEPEPAGPTGPLEPGRLAGTLVGTGDGALRLVTVQPEGKAPMSADSWLHGLRPSRDERLASPGNARPPVHVAKTDAGTPESAT
jgi:methionyl-tRNA formyltransferase